MRHESYESSNNSTILSWHRFAQGEKSKELICSTNNFFVVPGYGAFISGYLIILAKYQVPAFSDLKKEHHDEFRWLVNVMSQSMCKCYQKSTVHFEHGMCGCIDSGNAHLHIMPVSRDITSQEIKLAINTVLEQRGIGIEDEIDKALRTKLRSPESRQQVWSFEDLPRLMGYEYPGYHYHLENYFYFRSPFPETSFLTNANLGSQFGREVIFELEKDRDEGLKLKLERLAMRGKLSYETLPWRWQDFTFKESVYTTKAKIQAFMKGVECLTESNRFGFKLHSLEYEYTYS